MRKYPPILLNESLYNLKPGIICIIPALKRRESEANNVQINFSLIQVVAVVHKHGDGGYVLKGRHLTQFMAVVQKKHNKNTTKKDRAFVMKFGIQFGHSTCRL